MRYRLFSRLWSTLIFAIGISGCWIGNLVSQDVETDASVEAPDLSDDVPKDAPLGTLDNSSFDPTQDFLEEEPFNPKKAIESVVDPPPGCTPLTKDGRLWVDIPGKRVILDGYIAMQAGGPLEMFACPRQTKEHESVVAVLARSRDVHAALLAIGVQSGRPVQFAPDFIPPTGQQVRVWTLWRDLQGEVQCVDARQCILDMHTQKTLEMDWVFAGSRFWTDPGDGTDWYAADSGDFVCVSNFSSAMLDLPTRSLKQVRSLQFSVNAKVVPAQGTPVRLILVPIPIPEDVPKPLPPGVADPETPPTGHWFPKPKAVAIADPKN